MRVISSIDVFYRTCLQWNLQKLANSYCASINISRLVSELEQYWYKAVTVFSFVTFKFIGDLCFVILFAIFKVTFLYSYIIFISRIPEAHAFYSSLPSCGCAFKTHNIEVFWQ